MRSLLSSLIALSLLAGCVDDADNEEPLGDESSELVTNPTAGGPWGSLETCSAKIAYEVPPNGAVPAQVLGYMNNAAANWGHSYAQAWHAAASTGPDGLGAVKWFWGPGGNQWGGLVYWNNATQCAYYVPNSDSTCIGSSCTAYANGTSRRLYEKYASLSWHGGALGLPISNPVQYGWTGVTYQLFTRGVITYSSAQGAHYAGGTSTEDQAVAEAWKRAFAVTPLSGPATYAFMEDPQCANQSGSAGDCSQAAGRIGRYVRLFDQYWGLPAYAMARTGSAEGHVVWGPHAQAWLLAAGAEPWKLTGFPRGNLQHTTAGDEYYRLEHGTLFRRVSTGEAFLVTGAIYDFWATDAERLGWPTGPQYGFGDGGFSQSFSNGNVYQRPDGGLFIVDGASNPTLSAYLKAGGPRAWGYPTDNSPLPGTVVFGPPRNQHFDQGIYVPSSPTTGTWLPHASDGGATDLHLQWGSNWTDLHWTNVGTGAISRTLMRSIANGPMLPIMSLPVPVTTAQDNPATAAANGFTLRPGDQKVCYQIITKNAGGQQTASNLACHPEARRDKSVSRLTLAIRTSTIRDAKTKHRVRVLLQHRKNEDNEPAPFGNSTWLDSSTSNFGTGDTSGFDLSTKGVSDLADITQLVVEVPGSDALCVAGVNLMANDVVVFSKELGEETCGWAELSTSPGGRRVVLGTFHELRASPDWKRYNTETGDYPPVLAHAPDGGAIRFIGFGKTEFISKLDSMVADKLFGSATDSADVDGEYFYPRFRDGHHTETTSVPGGDTMLDVVQHVWAHDGWYGDVWCDLTFRLVIVPEFQIPGEPSTGTHIDIPAATSDASCGTDSWIGYVPVLNFFFTALPAIFAEYDFNGALDGMNGPSLGSAPGMNHFCFGNPGAIQIFGALFGSGQPQSFSVCFGTPLGP